jgi:hypothetical protein
MQLPHIIIDNHNNNIHTNLVLEEYNTDHRTN